MIAFLKEMSTWLRHSLHCINFEVAIRCSSFIIFVYSMNTIVWSYFDAHHKDIYLFIFANFVNFDFEQDK